MFKKRACWSESGGSSWPIRSSTKSCPYPKRKTANKEKLESPPPDPEGWKEWLAIIKNFYLTGIPTVNSISEPSNIQSIEKSDSKNSETLSINDLLNFKENDNRPYISVTIGSVKVDSLLDTGSNVTILGQPSLFLLKKLNLSINYDISVHVTTADSQIQTVLGYVWLPITLLGVTKDMQILIIPSITQPLILGMDFINSFNLSLDFGAATFVTEPLNLSAVHVIQSIDNLSNLQKEKLQCMIDLYKTIAPTDRLGRTHVYTHSIDTKDAKPIRQRQYPLSPAMQEILNKEVDRLLALDVVRPVTECSPWLSPLWLVKKTDGSHRLCFDGRKLNSVTQQDAYPMPLIDSTISKLRDAVVMTSLDLKNAFYQIPLDEESQLKTTFAISGRGLFCFKVLPFRLNNAAQAMSKVMDLVIGPALEPYVFYYLDDVIVVTPDFETHISVLEKLFNRLKEANLTINFDKCKFCRNSLKFLGFVVDAEGLRTDPEKVKAIAEYPIPQNTTQIRRLIGLLGYYRRFLKDSSTVCTYYRLT